MINLYICLTHYRTHINPQVMRQPTIFFLLCTLLLATSSLEPQPIPKNSASNLTAMVPDSMVLIPGGSFQMGKSDDENYKKTGQAVNLSSFYLSKYEVTVEEFEQFIYATGYTTDADKDGGSYYLEGHVKKRNDVNWKYDVAGNLRPSSEYDHPVVHVSWNDATAYCQWLSQKTGQTYRLPTEAEWEYAARGVKNSSYFQVGSNILDEIAWYASNSALKTHPVGQKKANELGLYDMIGNVYEWCQDSYKDRPSNAKPYSQISTFQGQNAAYLRGCRGGSWESNSSGLHVTFNRVVSSASNCYNDTGFRVARQQ